MKVNDKEFCDAIDMFEKIVKKSEHCFNSRLDRATCGIKGIFYDNGETDKLFKMFLHGYEFGKLVCRD